MSGFGTQIMQQNLRQPESSVTGRRSNARKQILITGFVTLLPSGAPPSSAAIRRSWGARSTLTTLSGAINTVTFDARGAVLFLTADVFYLGQREHPEFGLSRGGFAARAPVQILDRSCRRHLARLG